MSKKKAIGVVIDCVKLNIRKEPDVSSEILCIVDVGTALDIKEYIDDNWAMISIDKINGYVMRPFIKE